MEQGLTPLQKLDLVLRFLADNVQAKPSITDGNLFSALKKLYPQLEKQNDFGSDLIRILNKLIQEGNVDFIDEAYVKDESPFGMKRNPKRSYKITFDGKLLVDSGDSYEAKVLRGQKREDLIKDQIQSTIDTNTAVKRVSAWNIRLFWVTLVIAIGTIAVPVVTFLSKEKEINRLNQTITQKDQEIQRLQKLLPGGTAHQPGK